MDGMKSVLLLMGLWLAAEASRRCQSSDDCSPTDCCVKLFSRRYASLRSPLVCRPRSEYEARGECIDDGASSTRHCQTDADCPSASCCYVQHQLRGRKRRQLQTRGGECTPLTPSGGTCYFSLMVTPPQGQHYRCPCEGSLTCESINVTEVPVGVLGQCV